MFGIRFSHAFSDAAISVQCLVFYSSRDWIKATANEHREDISVAGSECQCM